MTAAAFQHVDVLRRIANPGDAPPTIDALAEEFGRDPSNFRRTLKLLEADGLISREPGQPPVITDAGKLALRGVDVAQGRVDLADTIVLRHDQARPHPLNPRKDFTSPEAVASGELLELTIIDRGLDHNLVIRAEPGPDGIYFIIAGERRWRAIGRAIERGALPADFPIRCLPRDVDDKDHLFTALGENMDRENLSELDEGLAFAHARDVLGVPTVEIAGRIHRTQKYVQDRIRLTTLPEEIQAAMREPRKLADGSRNPRHVTFTEARDFFQEARDDDAGGATADQATLDLIGGDDAADPLVVNGLRYPNATRAAEARRLMEGAVHVGRGGGGHRLMELPPQSAPSPRAPEPETDRPLTVKARLALVELAHKVDDKGVALAEGGELAAYVGKYWTDQAFSDLAQARLVRAIHLAGGTPPMAALTEKGLEWFTQNGLALPVTEGQLAAAQTEAGLAPSGRYVTPWLDEEAKAPSTAPLGDTDDPTADTDAWDRGPEQIAAHQALLERVRAFVADPAGEAGTAAELLADLGVIGPFEASADGAVLAGDPASEIVTVDVNRERPNEHADAIALLVAWALRLAFEAA